MQNLTLGQALSVAVEFHRAGKFAEASSVYSQILAQQPGSARALLGLGGIAAEQGRFADAERLMRSAIALDANDTLLFISLGNVYLMQDKGSEAIAAFAGALALKPDMADVHFQVGNASLLCGLRDQAVMAYRQALAIQPDHPKASANLCQVLIGRGELDLAIEAAEAALALSTDSVSLYRNLARAYRESGRIERALEVYRVGLSRRCDLQLHSDLLFTLNFDAGCDRGRNLAEHKAWARAWADPHTISHRPHANDRTPGRKLRVGYVAYELGDNSLGRLFAPLLCGHDRGTVEPYVYHEILHAGPTGRRLAGSGATWRNFRGMTEERLAEVIRADGIDVLVDLAMHSDGCRLGVFARKPAPVQVTYLAYCGTTGVSAVDYRLTDRYLDPPGLPDRDICYAEKSVPLPGCYWCYPAPDWAPEVGPPPAQRNGFVTFGCLNEFTKINPGVLDAWCDVLGRVKGSRLLVHAKLGGHRARTAEHFQRRGIDPARVEFVNRLPMNEYFGIYNRIDVALDTFPWAGGTTTLDALWMGVPVVTLAGETAVSRGGLSILSNLGVPEWAAISGEQYATIAETLTLDVPELTRVHRELRERLRASPIMDAPRFVRGVEEAMRGMWERHCAGITARGVSSPQGV